jgi:hypothetical protein
VALPATLFVVWRIASYEQVDDEKRLQAERGYLASLEGRAGSRAEVPTMVFILYGDLGYGDIGPAATGAISTPHPDALAGNGPVLTDFHSPSPVCTPSRAGQLTGLRFSIALSPPRRVHRPPGRPARGR